MSASANEPIWINERGNVEMAPETFKAREIDLLTLEDQVEALQEALAEEREAYNEWKADLTELEAAINSEREARHELEKQIIKENYKWGLLGLVLGAGIVLVAD